MSLQWLPLLSFFGVLGPLGILLIGWQWWSRSSNHAISFYLDVNHDFKLVLVRGGQLEDIIACNGANEHLVCELKSRIVIYRRSVPAAQPGDRVHLASNRDCVSIVIQIDGITCGTCMLKGDRLVEHVTHRLLTVTDTRLMATDPVFRLVPILRQDAFDREGRFALWKPTTDVHSHYDGVLLSTDLLRLGKTKVTVGLANQVGSTVSSDAYCRRLEQERTALDISSGSCVRWQDFEAIYDHRDPLTCNVELFGLILCEMGRQYAAQAVWQVQLSLNAILDESFLAVARSVLPEIERTHGVAIRFLVAFYHPFVGTWPKQIQQFQSVAHDPCIVGCDFAGYEVSYMEKPVIEHLSVISHWIATYAKHLTMRVHVGETSQFPHNVTTVLSLAWHNKIRVRIAHCLHGLNDDSIKLLLKLREQQLVYVELCPDSNVALQHLSDLSHIARLVVVLFRHRIPFLLGSDGPGIFRTSPDQYACTLYQAVEQYLWLHNSDMNVSDVWRFAEQSEHLFLAEYA